MAEKVEKKQQTNAIQRFTRETVGELNKVSWPTPQDAWHLTKIVLAVLFAMALVLGILDTAFSEILRLILA
ncbi:MAG TPA: preprotein translocase subunit SecE [Anaerolineaceae bacterium]|nr:preprotein translocase subunit SecE [Anaerolineaceae bacterium]